MRRLEGFDSGLTGRVDPDGDRRRVGGKYGARGEQRRKREGNITEFHKGLLLEISKQGDAWRRLSA